MALKPRDKVHEAQIEAGTVGRRRGHRFERELAEKLRGLNPLPTNVLRTAPEGHLVTGVPEIELLRYIIHAKSMKRVERVEAWWLGGLATTGQGDTLLVNGKPITGSKSDIVIKLHDGGSSHTLGVSVKTCNKATPTNDQLYFTTASAFCKLLRRNGLDVTASAEQAMKMFCGDEGYRPIDAQPPPKGRLADPGRWFWEELPSAGRKALESLLKEKQDDVTRILLQKAYPDDPFPPAYVLHQTVCFSDRNRCPMALFSIDELVALSRACGGFELREYRVRKGRFKHDPSTHLAPRFGFVQFQRGGQKQHPTQLQFNLKAGYFNHSCPAL